MGKSFGLFGIYVNHPRAAMREAADSPPLGFAFLIFLLAHLSNIVAALLIGGATGGQLLFNFVGLLPVLTVFGITFLCLSACVIHFTAGLAGAAGRAKVCVALLALNCAPFLLLTPLALLLAPLKTTGVFLFILLEFALWVLVFALNLVGVQENYRLRFGPALGVVLAPLLLLFLVLTILGLSPVYLLVVFLLS